MSRQRNADSLVQRTRDSTQGSKSMTELQHRLADMSVKEQLAALQPERPFVPNAGAVQFWCEPNTTDTVQEKSRRTRGPSGKKAKQGSLRRKHTKKTRASGGPTTGTMDSAGGRVDAIREHLDQHITDAWSEDEDLVWETLDGLSPEERTDLLGASADTILADLKTHFDASDGIEAEMEEIVDRAEGYEPAPSLPEDSRPGQGGTVRAPRPRKRKRKKPGIRGD